MALNYHQLGQKIQKLRKKARLTQDELSDKAGLAYSTLAKIERGAIRNPSVFTISAIARQLGVSVESLLESDSPSRATVPSPDIQFIYCDINGVLVRFFQRAFVEVSNATGLTLDKVETTFWHYNDSANRGEMTIQEFNNAMATHLRIESFDWAELYLRNVEPIEVMHQFVREMATVVPIGLLSNTHQGLIEKMTDRGLIPDLAYSAVIDSSQVGALKPEDKIYQAAEKAAAVAPDTVLFVDDSRTNLMAAEKRGWHVVWFDDYRPGESVARLRSILNS